MVLINSREEIASNIGNIVVFYNPKNLNCIGALSFLRSVNTFLLFFSQIGAVIFTPKQEVERKSEWLCAGNFLNLILKLSEKTVYEQNIALSLVFFFVHMRHFRFDFYSFLMGFCNQVIVHSRSSVLFSQ